jgi:hypothetical protein
VNEKKAVTVAGVIVRQAGPPKRPGSPGSPKARPSPASTYQRRGCQLRLTGPAGAALGGAHGSCGQVIRALVTASDLCKREGGNGNGTEAHHRPAD